MLNVERSPSSLCGVWVEDGGQVHTTVATADGRREDRLDTFRPFGWLNADPASFGGISVENLAGDSPFNRLAHADQRAAFEAFSAAVRSTPVGLDIIRPLENQYLLQTRQRVYSDLSFGQLRRLQLDIEVGSSDGTFPDASRAEDRVLAIGLRFAGKPRLLLLEEFNDAAEKKLLQSFHDALAELDPDVIEGHNLFKFDLEYLRQRCRRYKLPCAWGRYGQRASFRSSRLKVAERWIDFTRCDIPGRAVVDTYLLVQLYDITTRELMSYGLKETAVYFGVTSEEGAERTYIDGHRIQHVFREDRARFSAYLEDDLRETQGLADQLLPTYFEQARTFPILLQDATLRGATSKIECRAW